MNVRSPWLRERGKVFNFKHCIMLNVGGRKINKCVIPLYNIMEIRYKINNI